MKVIFLDFDGVINNWDWFYGVDFENVRYLLEIIKLTGAKVVATTSNKYSFQCWKVKYEDTGYYLEYVKLLNEYGVEILDVTPYVNMNRELEILAYLELHPEIEQYVIIDDDYVSDKLKEHQVFLDNYEGIKEEHIEPAVRILNGSLGFYPPDFNFDESVEDRITRINEYHSIKKKM